MSGTSLILWYNKNIQALQSEIPSSGSGSATRLQPTHFISLSLALFNRKMLLISPDVLKSGSSEECKSDSYLDMARGHLGNNKYLACHIPRHNQNLVWSLKASASTHSSYRNKFVFPGSCLGPGAVGSP